MFRLADPITAEGASEPPKAPEMEMRVVDPVPAGGGFWGGDGLVGRVFPAEGFPPGKPEKTHGQSTWHSP